MRTTKTFHVSNPKQLKEHLLVWGQQYDEVVWLDSNEHQSQYKNYDAVLAVEEFTAIRTDYFNAFEKMQDYYNATKDWIFGYLSYDLKNAVEDLQSQNFDGLEFPEMYFFQPKKIITLRNDVLEFSYLKLVEEDIEKDFKAISAKVQSEETIDIHHGEPIKIKLRIHKDEYISKVETMLAHIHRGDIYEANFCQEFYAEEVSLRPLETFKKLNAISKPPFATYLKFEDKYLLCASPERYLKKAGDKVISQPIKGTAKRSPSKEEDKHLAVSLELDEKERSENIMIVDLVRNDLSQTATKGSVKVEELCKVYSFLQVHQMISTVSSKVDKATNPIKILKTTFPMGSMTGAPKISAMQIIETLEETKRSLYSGAVGYMTPEGDFDFNVVIRSILYNSTKSYVSYSVGSAITAKSNPIKEYEECLIKAKAMREVLEN
ncbi:anthranilate synthase component I family protein [uncultured Winogradskyella sp.]|uniref:anthranilate synthase component I family protein n=1 Tax=uncultured Winogradskyella sp. TaxID=395353 RepID=UPI0035178F9C